MLDVLEEQIIRRAARAQRRFFRMIHNAGENTTHRAELLERRVQVETELRGEHYLARPPLVADLTIPLHQAVTRELVAMRPYVAVEVQRRRDVRRVMVCSPFQELRISKTVKARSKLRQIYEASGLSSLRELALIIGVARSTVERHVMGAKIAGQRRDWYNRLRRIYVDESGDVHIVVARPAPTKSRWDANLTPEQRRAALAEVVSRLDGGRVPRPKY